MQQQQMMMYPHQYAPYSQGHYQHPPQFHYAPPYHQQNHQQRGGSGGGDDVKTLWVGDLLHWMDETYSTPDHCVIVLKPKVGIYGNGQVSSVKVIRNKQTNQSEGYGFVEFLSRSAAEEVLQSYSGVTMPNADQPFRLNWASFSTGEKRASENGGPDLSVFVGDLAPDVTDAVLLETFAGYQSVKGAKVVIDSNTGRSKGYGFVRFGDESERSRALTEMNGAFCLSRQMRVGIATPKRAAAYGQQNGSQALTLAGGHGGNGSVSDGESNNSTVSSPYYYSVINNTHSLQSAEEAIGNLNGTVIGKNTVRLSWGRSPNRQWRGDQQWNGGYSRGQGYSNGYANQDSNMYAAAAAAVPGTS
ncbi:Polyadenylate-binding protein RBP47A [Raphanus sativus]|nr:Polyadenylate-binding protein RBP47A [Raphanus sativus]